eukprot:SAG25_NODE_8824_length_402_cov_0.574257_1_plen_134_part_11
MSILDWFAKKEKTKQKQSKLNIPGNLWVKCKSCNESIFIKDLELNQWTCTKCDYHFRLNPKQRLICTCDTNSFKETDSKLEAVDTLNFKDTKSYTERLKTAKDKTKRSDAVIIGEASIKGKAVNIGILDFTFLG